MQPIGIQRIEARLNKFEGVIDMSDVARRPEPDKRRVFLSRALAAYCVKAMSDVDFDTAARSVTDMFHDRGMDAIYYDTRLSRLLIVQAKWGDTLSWRDSGEFVDGVRKLISTEWELFANNPRIYNRKAEIEVALENAANIRLVTVHHGSKPAVLGTLKRVDDLVADINGGSDIAEAIHWHQANLLDAVRADSDPPRIDADLYMCDWGEIKEPYKAVFGRIEAQALVALWKNNPHLCYLNLREYEGRTDVNSAIAETVKEEPEHFWYFNNGLTMICDSYKPGISGRLNKEASPFHFEGIQLVNGAQTTGIVSDYLDRLSEAEQVKVWIQVRVIELRSCPGGFANKITRFTNLQNAVSLQDFVAMDPTQPRLAADFAVVGRRYAFKWGGDEDPKGDEGASLREATISLACAQADTWFAVMAKKEISQLWRTDGSRYKTLFHKDLRATEVWGAVLIMRAVDRKVKEMAKGNHEKANAVAKYLQRIVLHLVFRSPKLGDWRERTDPADLPQSAAEIAADQFSEVCEYVRRRHPRDYLASLSKDFEKCRTMVANILSGEDEQMFFPEIG